MFDEHITEVLNISQYNVVIVHLCLCQIGYTFSVFKKTIILCLFKREIMG